MITSHDYDYDFTHFPIRDYDYDYDYLKKCNRLQSITIYNHNQPQPWLLLCNINCSKIFLLPANVCMKQLIDKLAAAPGSNLRTHTCRHQ